MTERELRERKRIAQHFFYLKYQPNNDPLAYNLRWEDIPFDGCSTSKPFYEQADKFLALAQQANYVRLADDQSLPRIEFDEIKNTVAKLSADDFAKILTILGIWRDRAFRKGWRKVEL